MTSKAEKKLAADPLRDAAQGILWVDDDFDDIFVSYVMALQARARETGDWGIVATTALGRELFLANTSFPTVEAATAYAERLAEVIKDRLQKHPPAWLEGIPPMN